MTLQEIFQALYTGKISLEDAKRALTIESVSMAADPVPEKRPQAREARTSKVEQASRSYRRKEAIAIVGMSGKYPDARNLTQYWDNLLQGKNAIREIPLSRWDSADYYDPNPAASGKMYCKWLGALDEIEYFDPFFFHLSPAEAEGMDPQQRLFLEEGYKAFEDAGYSPRLLRNMKCGVYLGILGSEYGLLLYGQGASKVNLFGTSPAMAAARLAYLLNLKGPAIPIDTACSSSLVATHLACQALWDQEIDMALVGGVSLCLTPDFYISMCRAGMLSPDGQCKAFDASANGIVPGEGVGALVLKRLAEAEADHDQIYGLIIGSGINQDGATNGITAPSVKSQIELEREIYEKYQIDPESISYVEMHGTGTKLGDPIELQALATVFQEKTQRKQYCAIGSVKTNIGHTQALAGVAGVQKVLLAMQQKKLVPTLHFEQPNEHFDFEASPFYVNTCVQDWKRDAGTPLRAAVSSFGFSGTNAHLVLEEYIPNCSGKLASPTVSPILFVLSAKSEKQLKSYAQEMKRWIQEHSELALLDIAFTLQLGREAMDYRLAIEADTRETLLQRLEEFVDNQTSTGIHTGQVKKDINDITLFENDVDGQSLLHIWCQKRNLAKIAQVWIRGVNVDWKLLYGSEPRTIPTGTGSAVGGVPCVAPGLAPQVCTIPTIPALPHRVSLPTYPFARERYWISIRAGTQAEQGQAIPAIDKTNGNGTTSNHMDQPDHRGSRDSARFLFNGYRKVALRSLADHPQSSMKAEAEGPGLTPRPILQTLQIEEELVRSLAQALLMEESTIDVGKPFVEMGLDSVIGVEWIHSLNKQYASNLAASSIYNYPTIRQLAGFLQKEVLKHQQTLVQPISTLTQDEGRAVGKELTPEAETSQKGTAERVGAVGTGSEPRTGQGPALSAPTASRGKEAIAIVGMSGRYPDARNLTQYWDNLLQGKNAIREVPLSRWDSADYYNPSPAASGKIYCKWLGALDEIEYFDPFFFHLSPAEAEGMDPQQRLFLEEGYKAFEDAGYSPELLSNSKCGVYLGIMSHEYDLLLSQQKTAEINLLGTSSAIAAARVAYLLNLKGPALAIDTACSSSLVATHLACQALSSQEIDMALVGGVSLYLTPDSYIGMCSAGMLSPDGQCKAFDASANGFVPGEGVGAVVLKRLADAEAAHDQIYGVIIGSGMNQDGSTNGITAPSAMSQIDLAREIYEKYHIDPESISYVEMHGTGTQLGDPIELEALATVFCEKTQRKQYCAIGSVKSNIGHTSAAAGVASVHKVLLAMQQKKLVPTLHYQQPNPHFDFTASPFYVNASVQDWKQTSGIPRRAAVSSFGFSGTNAHLVLEEYLDRRDTDRPYGTPSLFVLSAKSEYQLKSYAREMKWWIQAHEELALEDIALTLQVGRSAMDYRLAIVADSQEVLLQRLQEFIDNQTSTGIHTGQVKKKTSDATLFEEDSDGQSLLHIWCQKRKLEKLAQVWVQGVNVDWKLLYGLEPRSLPTALTWPYRVSLPTYPFARERYWVSGGTSSEAESRTPSDGLSARPFAGHVASQQTLLLTPVWKEKAILGRGQASSQRISQDSAVLADPLVLLCGFPNIEASRIQAKLAPSGLCHSLHSSEVRRERRFQDRVLQLIQMLQHFLQSQQPVGSLLVQVVVADTEEPSLLSALAGVLKTAQLECPKLQGQLIEVEGELEEEQLLVWLRENQNVPLEGHIRYRDGQSWVREWPEVDGPQAAASAKLPWKEGGCYLITGGAGGLARLFVQEIAQHVREATVILVGRSVLSQEQQAQLEKAGQGHIHIDYQQVDVTDGPAVHDLIQRVLEQYGDLDGIIHAAGVLRDSLLLNKTTEGVLEVLAPKVVGVEHLDEASSEIPLDFFVLCSSLSAVTGNVGQADYAAANAYLDAFAHARAAQVLAGERQGATVSINWPLWEEGGMQIEAETVQMMEERLGIAKMGTETGMMAFYQALTSERAQVIVLHGRVERIKQQLLPSLKVTSVIETTSWGATAEAQQAVNTLREEELWERATAYFRKQLATVVKLSVQQIEDSAPLSNYGFDSIMAIRFTNLLEGSFGPLSKTLLFEYPTLQSVTEYFLHSYPEQMRSVLRIKEAPMTVIPQVSSGDLRGRMEGACPFPTPLRLPGAQDDIAIIGLAGRYPGARDLHAFWENLRTGRDCITEIPPERWDHRLYFDPDKNKLGTTYNKWGGFLDGVDEFDPLFFNISPRDAEIMDPQERLFLECAYATLEDAGYTRSWDEYRSYGTSQSNGLPSNVGVFVGVMYNEYQLFGVKAQIQGQPVALSGSSSSIANRVSYFCNFHGPSLAVDTMCSGSLTAIHLACQSIRAGDCRLALAGGVNVSIHPNKYLGLSQAKFVSSQGRCASFGQGADGYVPAEGVGAILLKPLTQAEIDGDHIYAVIKASAINHGGQTNGYTVPNPVAQAAVIAQALKDAGIDPRTISYVEAHGTGTVLGDPIEIAGLTRAFQQGVQDNGAFGRGLAPDQGLQTPGRCAIGSVKSNIGHAESAAGIAGVTKVLLQMHYGQLVPSLHAEVLNPHIDFSTTPFVVQQELSEWKQPQMPGTAEGKEAPRRAAISSFGAGGSNAHLILEEYVERQQTNDGRKEHPSAPVLIVLSAHTEEQLEERVQQLVSWIQEEEACFPPASEPVRLDNMAYTLQVGREAMEERLAFQVNSLAELEEKLHSFLQEPEEESNWYRGRVKRHDAVSLFPGDEDGQKAIAAWMSKGKYDKLLEFWVKGGSINWKLLYGGTQPHRISLPTYPFARERYWVPAPVGIGSTQGPLPTHGSHQPPTPTAYVLHPLVQYNTSTLWEQQFSSTLHGDEFFLTDHVVKGQRILPGVAYLEMAYVAVKAAIGTHTTLEPFRLDLRHVMWVRPLIVGGQPVTVRITLSPQEDGTISFAIQSDTTGEGSPVSQEEKTAERIYCQGEVRWHADNIARSTASQDLDLPALQARCPRRISATECYQRYHELGISYGPAFQAIEQLRVGEGEVLARLRLPSVALGQAHGAQTRTEGGYVLHPSMLDAALHASIGLLRDQDTQLQVPIALSELSIEASLPIQGWAWIRLSPQRLGTDSVSSPSFDIEVCDDAGRVALRLRELSCRTLPHRPDRGASPATLSAESGQRSAALLSLVPLWHPIVPSQQTAVPGKSTDQVVIVGGTEEDRKAIVRVYPHAHTLEIPTSASLSRLAQRLQEIGTIKEVFWLAQHDPLLTPAQEGILAAQQQGILACFHLMKALFQIGYEEKTLRWTVITRETRTRHVAERGNPTHAGLLGLFGSLAKEVPHWNIQQVDLPADIPLFLDEIRRLPADPQGHGWLSRNGHWYRQLLVPLDISTIEKREAYRRGGVYVVIGGAGGIGTVWSEYLIRKYQAQIIWIGRRKIDADIEEKLERLATLGPGPQYIMADATDRNALQHAYQEIKQRFGHIHGLVHSAIVLLDQSLANMSEERFQATLSAKVEVSVRLAQVFEHEALDFVLFFSSLASFTRNAGQGNYAAGCTFEDAFAARLRLDWGWRVKVMNWGYWGSVGIVASPEYRERMAQAGVGSIEPAEAMETLEVLMSGPVDQMVVLKTTRPAGMSTVSMSAESPEAVLYGEMIQAEETVMIYPEHAPSCIRDLMGATSQSAHPDLRRELREAEIRQEMQEMNILLGKLLWGQLQSLGLFREKHTVLTDLRVQAGISTGYDQWLQESVALLERQQYLYRSETPAADGHTTFTIVDPTMIESTAVWQEWNRHKVRWMQNADLKAYTELVEATLYALPAVLTGKRLATEILFPNGSMKLVAGIYQHDVLADSFNELLAQQAGIYVQKRLAHDRDARIRILEIGAGTGGTTNRILQMLHPYQAAIAVYCYSDISEIFLHYGQQVYGAEHPFLSYRLFHVEKPLAGQAIEPGSYDLVIATNVLHATSNIRRAVRNAKAALKKHGLLLLNEITGTSLLSHLTFGLLEGWWAYEDPELRVPGCPALTGESWEEVLSSEGFGAVYHAPQNKASGAAPLEVNQQVIVAETDGVVRQLQIPTVETVKVPGEPDGPTDASPNRSLAQSLQPYIGSMQDATSRADNRDEEFRQRCVAYFKEQVGKVLHLSSKKIDAAEPLTQYGLDSLTMLQLTNVLRTDGESISSTLFFEYQTIDALVEHLLHTQKDVLERLVGISVPTKQEDIQDLDHPPLAQPKVRVSLLGTRGRDIAIIGVAGRYPGAKDIPAFWNLLKSGKSAISEIPASRWDWRHYFQPGQGAADRTGSADPQVMYTKWGGFLEDIESFDAPFFGISPREAEDMDPQERLFLEVSSACIQDAGYTPATLQEEGSVGVFVGVMNGNYPTGAAYWSIANRVSFTLGLQGPSVAVDTACSSSLTALHFAVESLISETSVSAMVGGVNLIVDPVHYVRLSRAGKLSTGDQCKSFGEGADGIVDGEGVGALLLKPLQRAEADGDHIYGVIKATAINHGGKTSGYTVPNPQAQARVIEQALKRAGIDPRTISYVEAHGTGTVLGDPIEIAGLTRAFEACGATDNVASGLAPRWCAIGSVKSNIGHAESAAGIAGVTKVLLQMRYGQLVPSLHASPCNPYIDFSATPFVVQQELSEWKRPQLLDNRRDRACLCPRRAGISSFGAGGSNAHVILEEYMEQRNEDGQRSPLHPALIVLSARTEVQLYEQVRLLLDWIQKQEFVEESVGQAQDWHEAKHPLVVRSLGNLAYTLQVGREAMEERLALQVNSLAELEEKLRRYLQEPQEKGYWYRGQVKRHKETVALLSTNEGLQATIDKWLQHGQYEKLLEWWVKGLTINWKQLYTVGARTGASPVPTAPVLPRRISLPTYPFARYCILA